MDDESNIERDLGRLLFGEGLDDEAAWLVLQASTMERQEAEQASGLRKWIVGFAGSPREFAFSFVCPWCHATVHATGVSYGPCDEELEHAIHRMRCPSWRAKAYRFYWFTIRTFGRDRPPKSGGPSDAAE